MAALVGMAGSVFPIATGDTDVALRFISGFSFGEHGAKVGLGSHSQHLIKNLARLSSWF